MIYCETYLPVPLALPRSANAGYVSTMEYMGLNRVHYLTTNKS
jgi:hypothetical protein